MTVNEGHFLGITPAPPEDDSPLVVNSNAVKTYEVAAQVLQPVARRASQILNLVCCIQDVQFSQNLPANVVGEFPNSAGWPPVKKILGRSVPKGIDHPVSPLTSPLILNSRLAAS